VFDFDNTCIYRDVGKAVFRFQLSGLHFRLSPEQLANLFPKNVESIKAIPLKAIRNRIINLYKVLWPYIQQNQQKTALLQPEYDEFQGLLSWYCREARMEKSLGPLYSLPLLAKCLGGYTMDEVEDLTCHAIMAALYESIAEETRILHCCGSIGPLEIRYETGMRVQPEILYLMKLLQHLGVRCCVVSASAEWIVKAATLFFNFPVSQDDVYGIRLQIKQDGVLSTKELDNYPITYREGKVQVIKEYIQSPPILVAGDADTDFEMLHYPLVPIRLLINHNKSGLISSLYDDPRFLLQGLDKRTGSFRRHRETLENSEKRSWSSVPQSSFQSLFTTAA